MASNDTPSLYPYSPSHGAAIFFSILVSISLLFHVYQAFRYHAWRVTFFMVWGGVVFASGWILRSISTYNQMYDNSNQALYIAQTTLIFAGPPIYAAAEYNILGRLMVYLPMHAPLHPYRVIYVFIYLGAAVESLTGSGAPRIARGLSQHPPDFNDYHVGVTLISVSLVLQGVVELMFIGTVALMYRRAARANMLTRRVRMLCVMLFGTSTLILLRCLWRAIQSFAAVDILTSGCNSTCRVTSLQEWYLYVFEAAPMVVYTFWLNVVHPGMLLPQNKNTYLDYDGVTERAGPGWVDKRSKWQTFIDPFDLRGAIRGEATYDKFWLRPDDWPVIGTGRSSQGDKVESSSVQK